MERWAHCADVGWLKSSHYIFKELLLVVQQELGKGIDGVDGF